MTASGLEQQLTKGLGKPMCNSQPFADHIESVSCLNAVPANKLCVHAACFDLLADSARKQGANVQRDSCAEYMLL